MVDTRATRLVYLCTGSKLSVRDDKVLLSQGTIRANHYNLEKIYKVPQHNFTCVLLKCVCAREACVCGVCLYCVRVFL